MQQFCTYGSVRGAVSNGRPYRDNRHPEGHECSVSLVGFDSARRFSRGPGA
jgi:hypothetical protein